MKKALSLLLSIALLLSLCACKSKEVKSVEEAINAIGPVTANSESAILNAQNLYDALSNEDKQDIENFVVLETAIKEYPIRVVEAEIEKIGTITADSKEKIQNAQDLYDALSDEEKSSVQNIELLFAAKEELPIKEVESSIASIGEVTLESDNVIARVERMYKKLNEAQRSRVSNADVLVEAREKYVDLYNGKLAAEIDAAIEEIGDVSDRTRYKQNDKNIKNATEMYNSALESVKAKVKNYAVLEKAKEDLEKVLPDFSTLKVGDRVMFDQFECRVLDVKAGKALLITEKAVDCRPYDQAPSDPEHPSKKTYRPYNWSQCTLREYLNGDFLQRKFADKFRDLILLTHNATPDNTNWGRTDGGPDTDDYLFCLSTEEAYQYFDRIAIRATTYASGVNTSQVVKDIYGNTSCFWWLRSPGKNAWYASIVLETGEVQDYGYDNTSYEGVRPAFWIDTTK